MIAKLAEVEIQNNQKLGLVVPSRTIAKELEKITEI